MLEAEARDGDLEPLYFCYSYHLLSCEEGNRSRFTSTGIPSCPLHVFTVSVAVRAIKLTGIDYVWYECRLTSACVLAVAVLCCGVVCVFLETCFFFTAWRSVLPSAVPWNICNNSGIHVCTSVENRSAIVEAAYRVQQFENPEPRFVKRALGP